MSCNGSNTYGPVPTWSKRSTSDWLFFPLGPARSTVGIDNLRLGLELHGNTGNARIRGAVRTSNDGVTWDTPAAVGSLVQTGDGVSYDTGYTDVSSVLDGKALYQEGVEVSNSSGTVQELCLATVRFDRKGA